MPDNQLAPPLSAAVEAAASAQRLGAASGSLVNTKYNIWLGTRPSESFVYLFEHGLVRVPARGQTSAGPPQACRWDEISTTYIGATHHYQNGIYQRTEFKVTLQRANSSAIAFAGSFRDPAKVRKRTASTAGDYQLYSLLQKVSVGVANRRFPAALEALKRGERLRFGDIEISRGGIATNKGLTSWSSIRKVEAAAGHLQVTTEGKRRPLTQKNLADIPNYLLLLALADVMVGAPS